MARPKRVDNFDMPSITASYDRRAGWVVGRLMQDFPEAQDFHCAAVVGNLGGESGLKPIQEYGKTPPLGGFGWAQWTASRRRNFEAFCLDNNFRQTDDEANYLFLVQEMKGDESLAWKETLKATTLEAATETFLIEFERPADPEGALPARIDFARRALAAVVTPTPAPPTPAPLTPGLAFAIVNSVKALQSLLVLGGFYSGNVDGDWGPNSQKGMAAARAAMRKK